VIIFTGSDFTTPLRIFNKDIQDVQDENGPEIILKILNILVDDFSV